MKIAFAAGARPERAGVLVRFVPRDQRAKIIPPVSEAEFSGEANSRLYFRHENVLFVGLGERSKIQQPHTFRSAAGTAVLFLKRMGRARAIFQMENWPQFVREVVEGAVLADYRFEQFKTEKATPFQLLTIRTLPEDLAEAKRAAVRGHVIAEAVNLARDVGNQPGNLLYPEVLAARALKVAKDFELAATVFDEKRLRAGGFGGLIAVGQGSARPPRLIVLDYRGGRREEAPIALVGKAITFDTGGISIKPAENMENMVFDKCGGVAVLGAMAAISKLRLKRNVVGIIASAENMPGGSAFRPGDIVTAYGGKHIEIINTDAEGRVVQGGGDYRYRHADRRVLRGAGRARRRPLEQQ